MTDEVVPADASGVEESHRSPSPTRRSPEVPPAPKKRNHRRSNTKTEGASEGSSAEETKKTKRQVNYVFTDSRREAFYNKCVPANKAANQQRKEAKENKSSSSEIVA